MESFRDTHGILDTINFYIQKFELYPGRAPRVDTSLSGGSLVAAALVDVGSLDANDAKTMPERCQKKMASWQQFLCPKDTHTKNTKIVHSQFLADPDASRSPHSMPHDE
eukprot:scaffold77893_cov40-Cyclotella_meneghiniana.AAC.2